MAANELVTAFMGDNRLQRKIVGIRVTLEGYGIDNEQVYHLRGCHAILSATRGSGNMPVLHGADKAQFASNCFNASPPRNLLLRRDCPWRFIMHHNGSLPRLAETRKATASTDFGVGSSLNHVKPPRPGRLRQNVDTQLRSLHNAELPGRFAVAARFFSAAALRFIVVDAYRDRRGHEPRARRLRAAAGALSCLFDAASPAPGRSPAAREGGPLRRCAADAPGSLPGAGPTLRHEPRAAGGLAPRGAGSQFDR